MWLPLSRGGVYGKLKVLLRFTLLDLLKRVGDSLDLLRRLILVSAEGCARAFPLEPGFNLWVAIGFVYMERRFAVGAKSFSFSIIAGKTELHLEERRQGFVGSLFESPMIRLAGGHGGGGVTVSRGGGFHQIL
jgi:hypothetical protein